VSFADMTHLDPVLGLPLNREFVGHLVLAHYLICPGYRLGIPLASSWRSSRTL
jgi:hypothetical protein